MERRKVWAKRLLWLGGIGLVLDVFMSWYGDGTDDGLRSSDFRGLAWSFQSHDTVTLVNHPTNIIIVAGPLALLSAGLALFPDRQARHPAVAPTERPEGAVWPPPPNDRD